MLVRSDLDFILKQIKIAEAHSPTLGADGTLAAGTPLQDLIPNIRLAYGLRSVDGSENNLLNIGGFNQTEFGAADTTFPRLLTPVFQTADVQPADFFGPVRRAQRRRPTSRPAVSCSTPTRASSPI